MSYAGNESIQKQTQKARRHRSDGMFWGGISILILTAVVSAMATSNSRQAPPLTAEQKVMERCIDSCDHNLEILITEPPMDVGGTVSIRGEISKASRFFPIGHEVLAICEGPCMSLLVGDNGHFFCTLKEKATLVKSCEYKKLISAAP
ncbi:hypothetical protein KBC70_02880 [Candidatus Woesebacteria bacterium]|nr:hypothetical protein [Candidatus Woesebacteria bacterium]